MEARLCHGQWLPLCDAGHLMLLLNRWEGAPLEAKQTGKRQNKQINNKPTKLRILNEPIQSGLLHALAAAHQQTSLQSFSPHLTGVMNSVICYL